MSTAATITTLEVSVKVIRIGTKQCTQAVFRQLDERDVPPSTPRDQIWGRVSYCTQGCRSSITSGDCTSLVWSDGAALYRQHIERGNGMFESPTSGQRQRWDAVMALPLLFIAV